MCVCVFPMASRLSARVCLKKFITKCGYTERRRRKQKPKIDTSCVYVKSVCSVDRRVTSFEFSYTKTRKHEPIYFSIDLVNNVLIMVIIIYRNINKQMLCFPPSLFSVYYVVLGFSFYFIF